MSIKGTPKGSDENLTASTDSFWEVGNYRRTVKRIDDGAKLCDELMKLVAERAEIEAKYSSKLEKWAKKWEDSIKLGPEYNTIEAAMKGTVNEANSRAQVHTKCKNDLMDDVFEFVRKWKIDNYHKSLFQWKETKEAEDGFAKSQKPWAKFLMKVMRAKKAYHTATKAKDQADKQVTDANNDPNFPPDKLRKLEDLVEKKREDMEKTKVKYERRLDEITHDHNDTYAEGMTRQFEKCQEFEAKRLEFTKEALMKYYESLNISEVQKFSTIFVQMNTAFQLANSVQDLDWWSKNHGTAMPHNWPVFEEPCEIPKSQPKRIPTPILSQLWPKPRDISLNSVVAYTGLTTDSSEDSLETEHSQTVVVNSQGSSDHVRIGNIPLLDIADDAYCTITEYNTSRENRQDMGRDHTHGQEYDETQTAQKPTHMQYVANSNQAQLMGYKEVNHEVRPPSPPPSYSSAGDYINEDNTETNVYDQPNPFSHQQSEEETPPVQDQWGAEPPPLPMDIGVPVRALYDYENVEEDELTFRAGDILTKLSEVDDQGWCLGRFEGREGLIPADYVEAV